VSYNTV